MSVSIGRAAVPGRRAVLAAAGTALAARDATAQRPGTAPAPAAPAAQPQIVNNVLVGREGWLFASHGEVGRGYVQAVDKGVCDLAVEVCGILRAARIEPAIALIPSKNRVYRQFTGANSASNLPDVQRRYAFLLGELRRGGTVAPDIEAAFRRAMTEQPATNLYFRADTHWTPRGAEVTASEMAKAIREANRLPPGPRSAPALAEPVTQSHSTGDLQRLLPPDLRGGFPPEEFRIRLPVQGGASSLLDDAVGDVAAVGSSFLEPRYGYVGHLARELGRPVQLAWRPNTVGPWKTLLEYLASADFRRSRPRMLIWHHLEIDMANGPNVSGWGRNAMPPQAFLAELRAAVGA